MVEPSEACRVPVNNFRTYSGSLSVWVVDYAMAAREVQLAMYGNTNIELGADHVSPVDMVNGTVPTTGNYYYSTTRYQYDYSTYNNYTEYESTTNNGFNWLPTLPSAEESTRFIDRWTRTTEMSEVPTDETTQGYDTEPYSETEPAATLPESTVLSEVYVQ